MLYKTIFLVVGLLATARLSAQNFALGIKGGYSLSDMSYQHNPLPVKCPNHRFLSGFHTGIEGRWALGKRFALLTGLEYDQKGYGEVGRPYDYVSPRPRPVYIRRIMFHYVNLSIVGSYTLWKGLSVQTGLTPGRMVDIQGKYGGQKFDTEGIEDFYNEFDLNVLAGLEYQFGESFFLAARYNFGIVSVADEEFAEENLKQYERHWYNNSIQISVGNRYYFGK